MCEVLHIVLDHRIRVERGISMCSGFGTMAPASWRAVLAKQPAAAHGGPVGADTSEQMQ